MPADRNRTVSPVDPWLRLSLPLALASIVAGAIVAVLADLGGPTSPRRTQGAAEASREDPSERGDATARAPAPVPEDAVEGPPSIASAGAGDGGDGQSGDQAESHFALGRDLATRNVADAPGASKEGLRRAEAELVSALGLGYRDPAAAQRLLAQTYGALAHEWAASGEEKRVYEQREREARRAIVALAPGDAEARYEYAILLEDRRQRIQELAEVVRRAPSDPRPRRALGEDLLELGDTEEGARQLVEAGELFDREDLEYHGPTILHLLRQYGREEEEERVRQRMETLGL